MKKIFLILVLFLVAKPVVAQLGYIGEIRLMSFDFPPKGWAKCNGQLLPINQNQALFSILGTTYGGDGRTTFALPDLRGRVVVGQGGSNTYGQRDGTETTTLAATHLPGHVHVEPIIMSTGVATANTATTTTIIAAPALLVNSIPRTALGFNNNKADTALLASGTTSAAGAASPTSVSTIQPYLTLEYCISLTGVFPN